MRTLKMLFGMMVVLGAIAVGQAANPAIDRITEQMPANSSAMRDSLAVQLVGMTPESVEYLAGKLTPYDEGRPGAEYGISAMTDFIMDQKKDAIREDYAMLLAEMIDDVPDKLGKAFLIEQLRLVGDEEVVDTVAEYLNDSFLCDFATRTLLTIGGDSVEAKLLAAFDTAYPENKLHLMQGLGEMQSMAGADRIQPYAASKNWKMRKAALQALANIGKASSRGVLKNAVNVDDAYKKADNASLYLLFARRQAEQGKYDACARICNEVAGMFGDDSYIGSAAGDSMAKAIGLDNVDKIKNAQLREKAEKQIRASLATAPTPPEGFKALFNGKSLAGWKKHDNLPSGPGGKWYVEDGAIVGMQHPPKKGGFLVTEESFEDYELLLETKIDWPFDSGVFLRVGPEGKSHQVTLDYRPGGQIGSIYCPWTHGRVHAVPDSLDLFKRGEWNKIRIVCEGEPARIKFWLNGEMVTDFQHTEQTTAGIPEEGGIALQVHPGGEGYEDSKAMFRNIFVRRIESESKMNELTADEKEQGFDLLFNGKDLTGWVGNKASYGVENGILFCRKGTGRNIYTEDTYDNFVLRFDFRLQPGTNNGLGIRTPASGDAAYVGMELQILDNTADKYSNLKPYQYHGSVYGVIPAKRGYLNPVGEWNRQEVIADGYDIKVILNGETILDGNIKEASEGGTIDGRDHPGLLNESGHIGFLGHGDFVEFKNIRIKEL
ncbi:hypothetical protein STSP2_01845 [Anaerohalosphaera lusitana]|uniref:3-keto-alpha-glucoside-1,2-lyase/3-keto-2-hydroxy-glucal hydratase domain-containing protein n=1 Tax=Anaerohalosphaera lusitana TaxID=1936003 RepID=A0A1U9NLG9_9BACT|nr:DUF1080 domain-containing protein [Anaerohalosphaera lusitana]AQT68675.1 hypothetical protein STSP2_01845 [Anaerohalosphaera lusitana]